MPPHRGGKVVAPATKGGLHFLERSEVGLFSSPAGRLYSFIQTGAFYNLEAPTTTLSGIAAVKLKNPRGHSSVKL